VTTPVPKHADAKELQAYLIPAAIASLADKDWHMRDIASKRLVSYGAVAVPQLIEALKKAGAEDKAVIRETLRMVGTAEAVAAVNESREEENQARERQEKEEQEAKQQAEQKAKEAARQQQLLEDAANMRTLEDAIRNPKNLVALGDTGWKRLSHIASEVNEKIGRDSRQATQGKKDMYVWMRVNDESIDGVSLGAHLSNWEFNPNTGRYEGILVWSSEALGGTVISRLPVFSRVAVPLRRFRYFALRYDGEREFENQYGEKSQLDTAYVFGVCGSNTQSVWTDFTYDTAELKKLLRLSRGQ
jgi:hypothetical protein